MRIIILGPPGSGKGTQSKFITEKYGIPQISIGNVLRKLIKLDCKLSKKLKLIINSGKLVDDDIIIKIFEKRIKKKDCSKGFLLDGFPRNIMQLKNMLNAKIYIDYVLVLSISDKTIIKRISYRQIHIPSGRVYNLKYNPPKCEGKDDITGEKLSIRKDDVKEVFYKRLLEFNKHTLPLIKHLNKNKNIYNIKYFTIDGNQSIKDINYKISNIFNEN